MAAKLEWKIGSLWLGRIEVARTEWRGGYAHRYQIGGHDWSQSYQDEADCRQDLESEVRRLLKDAGVLLAD